MTLVLGLKSIFLAFSRLPPKPEGSQNESNGSNDRVVRDDDGGVNIREDSDDDDAVNIREDWATG